MSCLSIQKISAYSKSFDFSDEAWKVVIKRDCFVKDAIGRQFARAVDSISANIFEGFYRYLQHHNLTV
ncbi:four helix bundle protein [Mariniphaga anaerophila]|uniref:Four helix bundle protein n=1 Tax=Mariniphaga anaerophila TaxID=1484053 RepID=A0A1M4TFF9_9BACT|nr:four helix bundle protein [Mariniphaga anaerophila]SHE43230.1 four helix bundle protein [Mariniphaga anaerophila]